MRKNQNRTRTGTSVVSSLSRLPVLESKGEGERQAPGPTWSALRPSGKPWVSCAFLRRRAGTRQSELSEGELEKTAADGSLQQLGDHQ